MKRYWDIEEMLKGSGWRRSRTAEAKMRKALGGEYKDQIYKKRINGEWIELTLSRSTWTALLFMRVEPPRSWRWTKRKEHEDEYLRMVRFEDIESVADLDAIGEELAMWRKKHKDPRRKRDIEAFEWAGEDGPEAYKQWRAEVRKSLLIPMKRQQESSDLRKQYQGKKSIPPWLSQRHLTQTILTDFEMMPEGITREQARRDIGKILREMEKDGILERMPPGTVSRETEWVLDETWAAEHVPKLKKLKTRLLR